jgi:esterase/lipase
MKKLWIMIVLICIGTVYLIENIGYERIENPDGILFGKLNNQDSESVVLIIAGSGPTDMDGNTAYGYERNDSLLQLSNELTKLGISTFRYDKRTTGKSKEHMMNQYIDFDVLVNDSICCIKYLKNIGYENIYIIGHSQGSLIGMLAALEEPVAGVVSIAGAGEFIDKVMIKQLISQYGSDSIQEKKIIDLQNGIIDYSISDDDIMFSPQNQEFLLSWMKYNPSQIISLLECDILLIQGDEDLQVETNEVMFLANACENEKLVIVPNMNHLMKEVYSHNENINSYKDPSFMVHKTLINEIASFVVR